MNVSRGLLVAVVGLVGTLSMGCHARVYGHTRVHYVEAEPVVFVDAPDLVYVEPGVYVVRDYDYPVYYIDGVYYSYRGGTWYHTSHWSDPWVHVHVNVVPSLVVHRDHRHYVRYHGHAGAHVTRDTRPRRHSAHASASVDHHGSKPSHKSSHDDHDAKPMKASGDFEAKGKVSVKDDRREIKRQDDAPSVGDRSSVATKRIEKDDDNERSSKSRSKGPDMSDGPNTRSASDAPSRKSKPSSAPAPSQTSRKKPSGSKKRSRR
jgi:hypothetical protein